MTVHADRVQQTTVTTGTGTLSLGAATAGYRTFVSTVGDGANVTYLLLAGDDWEVGTGTVTSGSPDTLSRSLTSSSTGSLLDLPAGTHTISLVVTGATIDAKAEASNGTLTNPTLTNYVETRSTASGTSKTISLGDGTWHKLSTTGNATITLPASVAGKSFVVEVAYGGVHTISWAGGTSIKWAGGSAPTATSVSGKTDIFVFYQDGSVTYGQVFGQDF